MTPQLQQLFAQMTPWGLTIGQSGLVILLAIVALIIFGMMRSLLRLGTQIMGCGCVVIFLVLGGSIAAMLLSNSPH